MTNAQREKLTQHLLTHHFRELTLQAAKQHEEEFGISLFTIKADNHERWACFYSPDDAATRELGNTWKILLADTLMEVSLFHPEDYLKKAIVRLYPLHLTEAHRSLMESPKGFNCGWSENMPERFTLNLVACAAELVYESESPTEKWIDLEVHMTHAGDWDDYMSVLNVYDSAPSSIDSIDG